MRPVPPSDVAARVDRLCDALSTVDAQRVRGLVTLLGDRTDTSVRLVHDELFPDQSGDTANRSLNRLVKNVAEAAASAPVDLTIEIVGAKNAGQDRRVAFYVKRLDPAQAATPEAESLRGRLIEGREAVLGHDEPGLKLDIGATGKPLVKMFLSWASDDNSEARRLWDALGKVLAIKDPDLALG